MYIKSRKGTLIHKLRHALQGGGVQIQENFERDAVRESAKRSVTLGEKLLKICKKHREATHTVESNNKIC